jgi:hypothetical protein
MDGRSPLGTAKHRLQIRWERARAQASGSRADVLGAVRGGTRLLEPVRVRSAVARLPAADDGADREVRTRRSAGASGGGVRRVSERRCPACDLRGEAHGIACDRGRLPRRRRRPRALRRRPCDHAARLRASSRGSARRCTTIDAPIAVASTASITASVAAALISMTSVSRKRTPTRHRTTPTPALR